MSAWARPLRFLATPRTLPKLLPNIVLPAVQSEKYYSGESPRACVRATIMGASTPAGLAAARLLKTSSYIHELRLHDSDTLVKATCYDLADVDTVAEVSAHVGNAEVRSALTNSNIVLVAVGRGEGGKYSNTQVLNENMPLVRDAICHIATYCPCARIVIASDPVNSMVPFASEILLQVSAFDPSRLLGASCDSLRAASVLASVIGMPAHRTSVVVVGGRSPRTAIPVFSTARPWNALPDGVRDCIMESLLSDARARWCDQAALLTSLPEGGYLARGIAAGRLVLSLARALAGYREHTCAFVRSDLLPGHRFMMSEVVLGVGGVTANLGIPRLSCDELRGLEAALPILKNDVECGAQAGRYINVNLPNVSRFHLI